MKKIHQKSKYLWSIDGSMSCTGVTIWNLQDNSHVLTTHIRPQSKWSHCKKLHFIHAKTAELLSEYPSSEVAIEKGFVRFNDSTMKIQRALGAVLSCFEDCEPYFYAPNSVKKTIGGHGHATKDKMRRIILERYPEIQISNLDESDSVAVGIHHLIERHGLEWKSCH